MVLKRKGIIKSSSTPLNQTETPDDSSSEGVVLSLNSPKEPIDVESHHMEHSSAPIPIVTSRQPTPDEILCAVDHLDGSGFEKWCAQFFVLLGFSNIELTKASGDQGVDIVAVKDDVRYAIQCKCYSSDIGNRSVQEVHAGKSMYACHVGVVVTNRYFTHSAKELAKVTGVLLWDRNKLKSMIQEVQDKNKSPPKQ